MKKNFQIKAGSIVLSPDNPEDLWEGNWGIFLSDGDKERIGTASFAGDKERGTVPFTITIDEPHYRNRGYGTEAIRALKNWAFYHKSVFEIAAVIEHENTGAIMAFQKAGYVFREGTRQIENYSVLKPRTSWMGLYLFIGIVIGLILAAVTEITWMSLIASILVCEFAGYIMDSQEEKYRKKVTGKK